MWKLLPVCLLVSCAMHDQQPPASGGDEPAQGRIVRQIDLPLAPVAGTASDQPARRTFQQQGMQGWLDETGAWHVRGEVRHGRLRCATYETGIQLGRGSPACTGVDWLTDAEYVTRLRHCNAATRLHEGGGQFADAANRLAGMSCVRVVVRCEGAC